MNYKQIYQNTFISLLLTCTLSYNAEPRRYDTYGSIDNMQLIDPYGLVASKTKKNLRKHGKHINLVSLYFKYFRDFRSLKELLQEQLPDTNLNGVNAVIQHGDSHILYFSRCTECNTTNLYRRNLLIDNINRSRINNQENPLLLKILPQSTYPCLPHYTGHKMLPKNL